jgi:hypothetical protein
MTNTGMIAVYVSQEREFGVASLWGVAGTKKKGRSVC